MKKILAALAVGLISVGCFADLRMPSIFADHMVLQADEPVPVWGWAEPGETVTVAFAGQKKAGVAGEDGKWQVMLDPMPVSAKPREVTIFVNRQSEIKNRQFTDVLVGEVWLCAGQSNMRMAVAGVNDAKKEIAEADYPNLRFFTVPQKGDPEPQGDVGARWAICSPKTVGTCTATGYFFGRKLYRDLNVPIGLIDISYGGAHIATFMDAETVRNTSAKPLIDKWAERFDAQKKPQQIASYCYNAMVHPIVPYAVRGALWYQGETNAGTPEEYIAWYGDYIGMMRQKFKRPELPFYHVQLAGFVNQPPPRETKTPPLQWAKFRLAQDELLKFPNTGMVTAMDIGMEEDIHPKNKQDVGRRLALCALNRTYGKTDVVCEGPRFKSLKQRGPTLQVTFSNCDGGLKLNGDFGGFSGVLTDGTTVELSGSISGANTVTLNLDGQEIRLLRYAYANYPVCPLVNGAGLPAFPFEQPVQ